MSSDESLRELPQILNITPENIDAAAQEIYDFMQAAYAKDKLRPFGHFFSYFDTPEKVKGSLQWYQETGLKRVAGIRLSGKLVGVVGLGFDHEKKLAEPAIYIEQSLRGGGSGVVRGGVKWFAENTVSYRIVVSSMTPEAIEAMKNMGYALKKFDENYFEVVKNA